MCMVVMFLRKRGGVVVKAGQGLMRVVSPEEHSVSTIQQLSVQFNLTLSKPRVEAVLSLLSVGTRCLRRGRTCKLPPVQNSTV